MEKKDRKKALAEWNNIVKEYPAFARALLVQQAILMESSAHGDKSVDNGMSKLLRSGLPVLFEDFWDHKINGEISQETLRQVEKEIAGGIFGCLAQPSRDPARCFGSEDDGWFDDPFAGGQVIPPVPPIPPMR